MSNVYIAGWVEKEVLMTAFREMFYTLRVKRPEAFEMAETMLSDLPVVVKESNDRKISRIRVDDALQLCMSFSASELTLRVLSTLSLPILLRLKMGIVRWVKKHRLKKAAERGAVVLPGSVSNSKKKKN